MQNKKKVTYLKCIQYKMSHGCSKRYQNYLHVRKYNICTGIGQGYRH